MKKRVIGSSLLAVAAGVGGKVYQEAYQYGKRIGYRDSFADNEDMILENDHMKKLKIKNHKGLLLQGYLLEKENAKKTVLVVHPFNESAVTMEPYIDYFDHLLGDVNILLIDAIAHGNSDGYIKGFGYRDVTDLMYWNTYLIQKYGNDHSIIMYGLEMGANMILNAAGMLKLKNVKAIISEGAYDDVSHYLSYCFAKNNTTKHFVAPIIRSAIKNELNYDIRGMNTVELVKNNEIPTIFIHSKEDAKVDFNCVLELFNNNGSAKELFPIKENFLFELDGLEDDYSKTVNNYIKRLCQ